MIDKYIMYTQRYLYMYLKTILNCIDFLKISPQICGFCKKVFVSFFPFLRKGSNKLHLWKGKEKRRDCFFSVCYCWRIGDTELHASKKYKEKKKNKDIIF